MIGFMIIGGIVSSQLKSKIKKYSQIATVSGLNGKEIAEKMLNDNEILDVKVISVPGKLTDHYNPTDRTINLSPDVYQGRHVSAAAIAAHECGHAVQHATAYQWLEMRSQMVPIVNFSNRMMSTVFIIGLIGGSFIGLGWQNMLMLFIILMVDLIVQIEHQLAVGVRKGIGVRQSAPHISFVDFSRNFNHFWVRRNGIIGVETQMYGCVGG